MNKYGNNNACKLNIKIMANYLKYKERGINLPIIEILISKGIAAQIFNQKILILYNIMKIIYVFLSHNFPPNGNR